MKKYLWMLSAAVVIGALRVKVILILFSDWYTVKDILYFFIFVYAVHINFKP